MVFADGGRPIECGWLNGKYGAPRQVWPVEADPLLASADRMAANRAMQTMLGMQRIDLQGMRDDYESRIS